MVRGKWYERKGGTREKVVREKEWRETFSGTLRNAKGRHYWRGKNSNARESSGVSTILVPAKLWCQRSLGAVKRLWHHSMSSLLVHPGAFPALSLPPHLFRFIQLLCLLMPSRPSSLGQLLVRRLCKRLSAMVERSFRLSGGSKRSPFAFLEMRAWVWKLMGISRVSSSLLMSESIPNVSSYVSESPLARSS